MLNSSQVVLCFYFALLISGIALSQIVALIVSLINLSLIMHKILFALTLFYHKVVPSKNIVPYSFAATFIELYLMDCVQCCCFKSFLGPPRTYLRT